MALVMDTPMYPSPSDTVRTMTGTMVEYNLSAYFRINSKAQKYFFYATLLLHSTCRWKYIYSIYF